MTEKILFVDDEPAVLEGYRRILRKDFLLDTATGGETALADVEQNGPYAVVVSDMRMPGMNGLELLVCVRKLSPQTVRVILTGHADTDTALAAVNEEAAFRFLTKPCNPELLRKTLTTCLLQHRLLRAEKDLLENTLMGSIKVLTDVLSLANPAAFGRSLRINRYVQHLVRELRLEAPWRYEAAAMLSQLGCITLEPEILEAAYRGQPLSEEDQSSFAHHPMVARELLANIPRLEGIAWIVGQQSGVPNGDKEVPQSIKTGAVILRVALAFDELKMQGYSDRQAITKLQTSLHCTEASRIIPLLATLPPIDAEMEACEIEIPYLRPGMLLHQEVRSNSGLLLAGKGQDITYPLIVRLKNLHQRRAIRDKVSVLVPLTPTWKDE